MNILIIGDIFGQKGKKIVLEKLSSLKKELNIDIVIANAENVAPNGKGIRLEDYNDLFNAGVDYFTLGNHAFKNEEIYDFIDQKINIIRPNNLIGNYPGKGYIKFNYKNKQILLVNLLGKELMFQNVRSPFKEIEEIIELNKPYDLAILDFHAETTSEKKVMSYYLRDSFGIVYGTHTHVQTADELIIDNKQAYITDVGMVGIYDSAIGVNEEEVLKKLLNKKSSTSFLVKTEGIEMLNGLLVELDNNLIPKYIKRINIK